MSTRTPRQAYAVAVCYTAVVLIAVSASFLAFSGLRLVAPAFTSDEVASARLEIYYEPVPASADGKLNPEEVMYLERDRKLKSQQVENQVVLERFRARRALFIWTLLLIASSVLWLSHWRLLRAPKQA